MISGLPRIRDLFLRSKLNLDANRGSTTESAPLSRRNVSSSKSQCGCSRQRWGTCEVMAGTDRRILAMGSRLSCSVLV
jgi:hypothetical protein